MIESSQWSPGAGVTDVGKILSKGIYKIYEYDISIKKSFENALVQMTDDSEFTIYMACLYLMSQLFKEKSGISPFNISKKIIIKKLSLGIYRMQDTINEGICYPNGYINKSAMNDIQRFRKICKEEYLVLF